MHHGPVCIRHNVHEDKSVVLANSVSLRYFMHRVLLERPRRQCPHQLHPAVVCCGVGIHLTDGYLLRTATALSKSDVDDAPRSNENKHQRRRRSDCDSYSGTHRSGWSLHLSVPVPVVKAAEHGMGRCCVMVGAADAFEWESHVVIEYASGGVPCLFVIS